MNDRLNNKERLEAIENIKKILGSTKGKSKTKSFISKLLDPTLVFSTILFAFGTWILIDHFDWHVAVGVHLILMSHNAEKHGDLK